MLPRPSPRRLPQLDPLLSTLMRDPVRLNGRVYDRASITQQLLADPRDPFSRAPISLSDLVAEDALRAEIDAWVDDRLRLAKAGE